VTATAQFHPLGATAAQIADSVERAIQSGRLRPGDALPSVRRTATELDVSPATVVSAYRQLRDRGLVTTYERSHTRVSARPPLSARPAIPVPEWVRDLSSGNPDPELLAPVAQAFSEVDLPARLYGEASVLPELRDLMRVACDVAGVDSAHIAVTAGGMDGLERVLMAHLRPGDKVAVEDPSYTGVLDLIRAMGLSPVPVAIDDSGPLPRAADRALAAGARAIIVTPRWQNPTGAVLSAERAAELQRVLTRHPRVLTIHDDHAGGTMSLAGVGVLVDRQHWAVVRAASKALAPDLRVAMVAGDSLTIGRLEGRQALGCGWVSYMLQRVTAHLWMSSDVSKLLVRAAKTYDARRDALVLALAEYDIEAHGRSGFNVWIPVEEEGPVVSGLLQLGWATRGGEPYRLSSRPAIRVTASTLEPEEAPRFAADLARVLGSDRRVRLA
jgi:DNA-binding transcriptional MocR family regulator